MKPLSVEMTGLLGIQNEIQAVWYLNLHLYCKVKSLLWEAATHLVPNPFGPRTSGPPLPVPMDKWSPNIWSPWTNGPQPIWSPYSQIITACPPRQTEHFRDHLSRGTKLVANHLSMGTKFLGPVAPWGQNWLGTVCPEGPINWGPILGD